MSLSVAHLSSLSKQIRHRVVDENGPLEWSENYLKRNCTFGLKNKKKTFVVEELRNQILMSVCVSSSLMSGMTHASHLHLTSTLSMMQSFQNHHQMAPSSVLASSLDMQHSQQSSQQLQLQNSSSSSSSDMNEPNSEMLLALIARNKTLEGKFRIFRFLFFCHTNLPSEEQQTEKV